MIPLRPITATVGKLIDDLQQIASSHPRNKEWYGKSGQGAACTDIFLKDDIVVLYMYEEEGEKHLTVNQMIGRLKEFDPALPVVLFFWDSYSNFVLHDGHLVTWEYDSCYYDYDSTDIRTPDEERIRAAAAEKFVDLGLSVRWATCNLGAEKLSEPGEFYAWGKSHPFRPKGLKHWLRSLFTKYSPDVLLEGHGQVPTMAQMKELLEECEWTWVYIRPSCGYLVRSNKPGYTDRWIFLPAAGFKVEDGRCVRSDMDGIYISSERVSDAPHRVLVLQFPFTSDSNAFSHWDKKCSVGHSSIEHGYSLRTVLVQ